MAFAILLPIQEKYLILQTKPEKYCIMGCFLFPSMRRFKMGYLKSTQSLPSGRCNAIRIKITPLMLQLVVHSQQTKLQNICIKAELKYNQ